LKAHITEVALYGEDTFKAVSRFLRLATYAASTSTIDISLTVTASYLEAWLLVTASFERKRLNHTLDTFDHSKLHQHWALDLNTSLTQAPIELGDNDLPIRRTVSAASTHDAATIIAPTMPTYIPVL
jgi:hypothetical protein